MTVKLFFGSLPERPSARRALRNWALELRQRLAQDETLSPSTMLVSATVGAQADDTIDLLLLLPHALIAGVLEPNRVPADLLPDGRWIERDDGTERRNPQGESPLEHIRRLRGVVRRQLETVLALPQEDNAFFSRLVGALILTPKVHPETQVALDIDDHRNYVKVVGLDELPDLAALLHNGPSLSSKAMELIVEEIFGGQLWHDGQRMVQEIASSVYQLRLLPEGSATDKGIPLLAGANLVGRRPSQTAEGDRITLVGDDLMSNDHAILIITDNGQVVIRDQSTNGTLVTVPGSEARRLYHAEQLILPGTELRMGVTNVRLEQVGAANP